MTSKMEKKKHEIVKFFQEDFNIASVLEPEA